jgi:hypothetical protein
MQAALAIAQDIAARTEAEFERLGPGFEHLSETPVRILLRDGLIRHAEALGDGTTSVRQALDHLRRLIDVVVMVTV